MYYLMANRHYIGGDQQAEVGTYPTREAAEMAADELSKVSYMHDEGELSSATYVITEDQANDNIGTGSAADGNGTKARKTRAKSSKDRSVEPTDV